jgi:hypothetical protein
MRLILHDLQPMQWWVAGMGIAGITLQSFVTFVSFVAARSIFVSRRISTTA